MSAAISWREVFTKRLCENGFVQEDIAVIYRVEMEMRAFFDFEGLVPEALSLQNIERGENEVTYHWKSETAEAACPHCGAVSSHPVGDYYGRRIQDVPQFGKAVYHVVRSRNYYCDDGNCGAGKFVERFYGFVDEHGRKTVRFKKHCIERSLGCGCNEAEREIRLEGGVVSNDSIGRYIKEKAAEYIEANKAWDKVRVIAIDDINLRKGDKSSGCTVFIDQETHKVLIIVRGTTKEAAKKVMEMFPSAEILSRDRASAYAAAGSELDLTQVADRFHLITNAQTAVKDALMASIPANIFIREGDGWVRADGGHDAPGGTPYYSVPEQTIEDRIRLAELTEKQADKYRGTMRLIELDGKGLRTADIAKELGIPYNKVAALRRNAADTLADVEDRINRRIESRREPAEPVVQTPGEHAVKTVGGPRVQPSASSIVDPYRDTVVKMWKDGGSHRTIFPVLQTEGYTGSKNAIYQYLLKLGKESPVDMSRERRQPAQDVDAADGFDPSEAQGRPELSLTRVSRNTIYRSILKEASRQRDKGSDEGPEKEPAGENTANVEDKGKGARPASSRTSPLSDATLDIIYGTEPESPQDKEEDKHADAALKKNGT